MSSRSRLVVLLISGPVIAFALIGGALSNASAREDTYQPLRMFQDVVSLIVNNYVEKVDVDHVMDGAMRGLADGLDSDSAYLSPDEVQQVEADTPLKPAGIGVTITRQYYLRIVAARDGSPAAAGRPADGRLHPRHRRQADARDVGVGRGAGAARRAGLEGDAHRHPGQRRQSARHRADAEHRLGAGGHGPHRGPRGRLRAHRRLRQGRGVAGGPRGRAAAEGRRHPARHRYPPQRLGGDRERPRGRAALREERHAGDRGITRHAEADNQRRGRRRPDHAAGGAAGRRRYGRPGRAASRRPWPATSGPSSSASGPRATAPNRRS